MNFLRCFGPHHRLDQVGTGGAAVGHHSHREELRSGERTASSARALPGPQRRLPQHPHMGLQEEPTAGGKLTLNVCR